jgi:hypothetical protein
MELADLRQPANAALCRHLEGRGRTNLPPLARPHEVARPYDSLGTHPDLVARLWDEIAASLPADCRFVVFGTPALVRPDSGIVFGFAGGTHTYALRLPEAVRKEALAAGAERVMRYPRQAPFDLDVIGPEWVFGAWLPGEGLWGRAAYEFAADPPRDG